MSLGECGLCDTTPETGSFVYSVGGGFLARPLPCRSRLGPRLSEADGWGEDAPSPIIFATLSRLALVAACVPKLPLQEWHGDTATSDL
jgi:hypothetical protein